MVIYSTVVGQSVGHEGGGPDKLRGHTMFKKICIAMVAVMMIIAVIPASYAASTNPSGIQPYSGWIGSDSPFYSIKLFFQNVDISLSGNVDSKLQKQLGYSNERLAEAVAAALSNNTGAVSGALDQYKSLLEAINATMDDEGIGDINYINAAEQLQAQDDNLTVLANNTSLGTAVGDLFNTTLNASGQIKSGRPFIYYNNTSYFIPPGQMKKLAAGGSTNMPPGLSKKGYVSPAPVIVNGTVVWPWDEGYDLALAAAGNSTSHAGNGTALNDSTKAHGNGKGNGNGNDKGNGNGGGNGNGNGKGNGNGAAATSGKD